LKPIFDSISDAYRNGLLARWLPRRKPPSHFEEATLARSRHRKASLRQELSDIFEHVDSTTKSGLTFLAPLTYLLTIEE
jgi:hypothetical protein